MFPPGASPPRVAIYDGASVAKNAPMRAINDFFAIPDLAFRGGVSIDAGDVDGDGRADVIVGAGAGGGPAVRVFRGTDGSLLAGFFAYDPAFTGGVSAAAADVTGDGRAEVVTGAGPGGGPDIRVFDALTGQAGDEFFAFDPVFLGGTSVAVARRS